MCRDEWLLQVCAPGEGCWCRMECVGSVVSKLSGGAEESQPGEKQPYPRGHPNVPVITVLATANFPPEWQCCCTSQDGAVPARLHLQGSLFLRSVCG